MKLFRQGDVLLRRVVESSVENLKEVEPENGRLILAKGEATGHHHSVSSQHAQLFMAVSAMILIIKEATELLHQEHRAITVTEGTYIVTRQREYSPERTRNVQD